MAKVNQRRRSRKRSKQRIGVISHPRSGTHLLMWIIYDSFRTPYEAYDEIFLTHGYVKRSSRTKVSIIRPCAQVMPSLYNVRDRLSIGDISFSDFLRTPYRRMPKTERCAFASDFPFVKMETVCMPDVVGVKLTPLEYWVSIIRNHYQAATLVFLYQDVVRHPEIVVKAIAPKVPWKTTGRAQTPQKKVGWYSPVNSTPPEIGPGDAELMAAFEAKMRKKIGLPPQ